MIIDRDNSNKIERIKDELKRGILKHRDLERVVFKELFDGLATKWIESLRISSAIRRSLTEETIDFGLVSIGNHFTSISKPNTIGIELQIGGAAIPLGLTDPITIDGDHAKGEIPLPLATNEAALIVGINRGIKTINKAAGVRSIVCYDGMTRAPVVECPGIDYA
jgi:hydroxymethylglutaryl-CoA reductase (NADPH)